jgi:predicted LPLAT superfamily acyltransferase
MLMERNAGDIDRHYFEHQGKPCPYRIIEPSAFLGGSIEMVAALKRGEIVAIMGDRLGTASERSLKLDFLGAPAPFPVAAWKLAAATGAPIAVLFPLKTGAASYRIELPEVIEVPPQAGRPLKRLEPYLGRYVKALEELCRKHPFQFFNFFDLWRS